MNIAVMEFDFQSSGPPPPVTTLGMAAGNFAVALTAGTTPIIYGTLVF